MINTVGNNLDKFRRWFIRIKSNGALLQNNSATIQLMSRTTLGPLKDEIDRYILNFLTLNPEKSRLDLAKYLKRSFLPANDVEYIHESMDSFRQLLRQSLRVFNRKYRDLADLA